MSSLNDTKKTNLDKKIYLQSQTKFSKVKNLQPSLLPPPSLQLQRQQQQYEIKKDSAEQKTENKRSFHNTQENIGKRMENAIITSRSNTEDMLIDYSRQLTESAREISLDYLKLQKDIINAFQPKWLEHMKTSVDNYLVFQNKMIMLYTQMCNGYLKTFII